MTNSYRIYPQQHQTYSNSLYSPQAKYHEQPIHNHPAQNLKPQNLHVNEVGLRSPLNQNHDGRDFSGFGSQNYQSQNGNPENSLNLLQIKDQNYHQKMYFFMKEQIQIAVKNLNQKFSFMLKQQSQEINKLQNLLVQNDKELVKKNQIIQKIMEEKTDMISLNASKLMQGDRSKFMQGDRSKFMQGDRSTLTEITDKSPKKQKLSITKRKSVTKINIVSKEISPHKGFQEKSKKPEEKVLIVNDLIRKMQQIQAKIDQINREEGNRNKKVQTLHHKIESLEKGVIKYFSSKINSCEKELTLFVSTKEAEIIKMVEKSNRTAKQVEDLTSNRSEKRNLLLQQMCDVKNLVQEQSKKQFKYDNYRLDQLQKSIELMKEKIMNLQICKNSNNFNNNRIQQSQHEYLARQKMEPRHALQRSQTNYQMNASNLSHFSKHSVNEQPIHKLHRGFSDKQHQIMKKSQNYLHNDVRNERSMMNESGFTDFEDCNQNNSEENESQFSEEDEFFYPQHRLNLNHNDEGLVNTSLNMNDRNNEEQQDFNNISRLKRVLQMKDMKMPVQIEIDQTGYAKFIHNGMYIIDQRGDGFEFSAQQLQQLTTHRIISI